MWPRRRPFVAAHFERTATRQLLQCLVPELALCFVARFRCDHDADSDGVYAVDSAPTHLATRPVVRSPAFWRSLCPDALSLVFAVSNDPETVQCQRRRWRIAARLRPHFGPLSAVSVDGGSPAAAPHLHSMRRGGGLWSGNGIADGRGHRAHPSGGAQSAQ